ncbi:MAG: DegV family protein [Lachnospiraceae bacterium]|nr:DegV family protein [Lachnospiraceae bacterium]
MKETFHIISDGSCDLPVELANEKNITIVPFYVSFDDVHYFKENVEIGIRDFYQQMVDKKGVYPKSSMPSIQDYEEAFLPFVKEEIPVICICITTKFSGSMQSALNAREIIREKYPQAEITVIDATINTVLQGQYVLEAASLRDNGVSYKDTVARLEEIKSTGRIFFTVGNMEYLRHGGRIGKVAAITGSVLDIRPVITLKQGEIFPSGLDRGRKRTLKKVMDLLLDYLKESSLGIDRYSIAVGYGYDIEEGLAFRDQAIATLKEKGYDINEMPVYQIGATIGVHTGPYPLGFGIIEKGFPLQNTFRYSQ